MIEKLRHNRLLVFNLRTDVDDHILGFTTRWLNELAQYYDYIDVLTTHRGRLDVAENITVYSTGRELGKERIKQLAQFYRVLVSLLVKNRYDACFAHMQPLFAVLAAPLLRLSGVKLTTWYTHRQLSTLIKLAEKVSYRIVSAVDTSFPMNTPKLRPLGHGIDIEFFKSHDLPKHQPPRVVHVARLTAIKNQHILIQAIQNIDCELVLVGDIPDGYDDAYKRDLKQLVSDLNIEDKVIFAGAQTPEQVVDWYNSATIAVNLSPVGLFDKAALEGMACAVPTIVSNPAFSPLMGNYQTTLQVEKNDDIEALKRQIMSILNLSAEERQAISEHLRQAVDAHHSLQSLVPKLISVMHTGELPTSS